MSEQAAELERIAARLEEVAQRLGSDDVGDDEAIELAREAGELSARAGSALTEALRATATGSQAEPGGA